MSRIKRIVHPTDFSAASRPAFARAVDLAKENRAELALVHVLAPVIPLAGDGYISPQAYEDLQTSAQTQARRQLDALVGRAKKAGARVTSQLVEGTAWEAIGRAARRADLIVMGTHGRSGLARLLLGSVAERVVGTAPCPVMTVRARGRR